MKVVFIWLRNMGTPMALNLAKASFGFNTDSSIKLPELTMTSCMPSLLREVDVIFTMLPSRLIVKGIVNEFFVTLVPKAN